jgi:hypothetical protein
MSNDATFGLPTFNSDVERNLGISDDKKAFTVTFNGLGVSLAAKGSAPIVTRAFSFALSLSGCEPGVEIPFNIAGFVGGEKGANAHLLFSVNDQTMVVDFPENSNTDFSQQLKYKVGNASELRITVFLLADRDSTSDAGVALNVLSMDAKILSNSASS